MSNRTLFYFFFIFFAIKIFFFYLSLAIINSQYDRVYDIWTTFCHENGILLYNANISHTSPFLQKKTVGRVICGSMWGSCGSMWEYAGVMWEYDDMRKTYRYTFVEYRNSCALKR